MIIENRSGAAGTVGATAVSLAAADGTTLLMGTVANIALAPSFYPIKYKPTESFTPVAMVASVPLVLVSSAAYGAPTMAQLSEKLRSGGREAAYASPGIGGPQPGRRAAGKGAVDQDGACAVQERRRGPERGRLG